jgi:hypothetical protein
MSGPRLGALPNNRWSGGITKARSTEKLRWKLQRNFRFAISILFIFGTEFIQRSYGTCKKRFRVSIRSKVGGFYGTSRPDFAVPVRTKKKRKWLGTHDDDEWVDLIGHIAHGLRNATPWRASSTERDPYSVYVRVLELLVVLVPQDGRGLTFFEQGTGFMEKFAPCSLESAFNVLMYNGASLLFFRTWRAADGCSIRPHDVRLPGDDHLRNPRSAHLWDVWFFFFFLLLNFWGWLNFLWRRESFYVIALLPLTAL